MYVRVCVSVCQVCVCVIVSDTDPLLGDHNPDTLPHLTFQMWPLPPLLPPSPPHPTLHGVLITLPLSINLCSRINVVPGIFVTGSWLFPFVCCFSFSLGRKRLVFNEAITRNFLSKYHVSVSFSFGGALWWLSSSSGAKRLSGTS